MHARLAVVFGVGMFVAAVSAPAAAGQADAPNLSRQQRAAIQALIRAIDTNASDVTVKDGDWPVHVLRASDGSHYVAFSIHAAEGLQTARPVVLYVRLASRRQALDGSAPERSAVAEWLAGQSPSPVLPRRGLAFGEMPTYGAGSIATRGPTPQSQSLQLLELERERAREKREAQERARKAALEGTDLARSPRPLLPFEDFELRAMASADATGAPVIRRSLTAGPGEYELVVGWVDPEAANLASAVRVARRAVSLPPASTTSFALSSVIVAEDVTVREMPVPPSEQARQPYSIGSTEIAPARDHVLTPDERLALVLQVINPRPLPTGKPDVAVNFRIFRRVGAREETVGTLVPQMYNELTLPLDFDVTKGHPIFAAVAVPLRAFRRGEYRLEIAANDRVAGVGAVTDLKFSIATTPAALLREAPPIAPPFQPGKESVPAAVPIMLGAIRASEGNDRAAIVAWQTAIDDGAEPAVVWPLIIAAHLRLGDTKTAIELARRALAASPNEPRLTRQLAAAYIVAAQYDDALTVLEASLGGESSDPESQWLALHALFAAFVSGTGTGSTPAGRAQIANLATRYAAAQGPHAALALEWAAAAR
jgi:hypothetical protein